jgi:hypothetical protein
MEEEANDAQSSRNIGGSWAGGSDGMQVTNMLLDSVEVLLLSFLRGQTQGMSLSVPAISRGTFLPRCGKAKQHSSNITTHG